MPFGFVVRAAQQNKSSSQVKSLQS